MDHYLIIPDNGLFVKEVMFKTVDVYQIIGEKPYINPDALQNLSNKVEKYEQIDFIMCESTLHVYENCRIVDKMWASKYTHETKDRLRFTYMKEHKGNDAWEQHIRNRKLITLLS